MRLIDADKLPKWTGYALSATEIAIEVERAPTVYAVPIVKCKDCQHYTKFNFMGQTYSRCDIEDDAFLKFGVTVGSHDHFFCAYGKRRIDDENG